MGVHCNLGVEGAAQVGGVLSQHAESPGFHPIRCTKEVWQPTPVDATLGEMEARGTEA